MAEPSAATQSPSVSSSSSGADASGAAAGSGGSPGACPGLGGKSCASSCADSFVSSSQPVSLFSTSQVLNTDMILREEKHQVLDIQPALSKEGKDNFAGAANKKMERLNGTNGDSATEAPPGGTEADVHGDRPCIPTSFPEQPAFLTKEMKDQELRNQSEVAASEADAKFTLLKGQQPHTQQSEAEGISNHSLSPSEVSAVVSVEKESPESPFEVIIDKATFDQEFKDSYRESTSEPGSWAMHTDQERTTGNSQDSNRIFSLRNQEQRHPASALLTRQFSRTTAALEEVSRCVSDMHNFTNEVLTWDLASQLKQPEKSSENLAQASRLDGNEYASETSALHPKICPHQNIQKIPVHSIHGSKPSTESGVSLYEKVSPDSIDSAQKVSLEGMAKSVPKGGGTLIRLPESRGGKCASPGLEEITEKVLLPDDSLKVDLNGETSFLAEMMEADSSGESDDTVIEDITADISFESDKRESEKLLCEAAAAGGGVKIQAEKLVFVPNPIIEADEREIKDTYSQDVSSKTHNNCRESVDDFETLQAQSDILGESPVSEISCPKIIAIDSSTKYVKPLDNLDEILPLKSFKTEQPRLSPEESSRMLREDSLRENKSDDSPEDLITTLSEIQTKKALAEVNAFEATAEEDTNLKTTFPIRVLYGVEDAGHKCTVPNKSTNGNQLQNTFSSQGAPVASLDLEQEQLTIRALKELGGKLDDRIKTSQEDVKAPIEKKPIRTSTETVTSTFAPESPWPEKSHDILRERDVKTASDLDFGITQGPTGVGMISSLLSKTEQVNEHFLTRLLTDFSVHDLIFWRDVKKTGLVFGTTLIMLLSLAAFSVISVASYLILALLSVTISFRIYKSVIQAVQKSEEGHPFKAYLDVDIALSSEAFHNYVNAAMVHVNKALKLIIRLFLVEDLVDSLKLAVFMWLMTYVGAVFNGITLLILAELLVFSVPIVYEKYKTQIDHYVGIARDQTKAVVAKIQAKLPGIAKKKAE
ncbi:reticulon-3 isoform X2 [Monodelphis domestica]|uniref:reticulon-3 isoform X2 n=1 Tax=Monodelphis domestica TaxID=13616 RepID=UPI0004431D3E|nr:reticulon-3 isoform X2 [Monodelphis domestica]